MSILISKNGKGAQILEKSSVDKEDFLQEYIHNNPEVIPIYEIQVDKKLYVAKREFPINSGPIDALVKKHSFISKFAPNIKNALGYR